jgi:hypothetical protein
MHPQPIVLTPEKPKLSAEMGLTLSLAFLAFTLLFVALLRGRLKYAALRDRVEAIEAGDA